MKDGAHLKRHPTNRFTAPGKAEAYEVALRMIDAKADEKGSISYVEIEYMRTILRSWYGLESRHAMSAVSKALRVVRGMRIAARKEEDR